MTPRRQDPANAPGGSEPLEHVLAAIRACRVCVTSPAGLPLPHEPRPVVRAQASARIAICGQAPGLRVHKSGVPFTDPSGDRLRQWMGMSNDEFYDEARVAIIPMGFCFPGYGPTGADLPPRPECAPLWRSRVLAAMPRVELMLVVGSYAIGWHLPDRARRPMTETVAGWRAILHRPGGMPALLPLPHPSWRNTGWLKANPWFGDDVLPELRGRVRALLR
jgi:uracil-DNA glycosylase